MTPRILTYFLCGMRHPTTGLSEDDLSRLTGSSSSTASSGNCSSSSSSSASSAENTPKHKQESIAADELEHALNNTTNKLQQQSADKAAAAAAAVESFKQQNNGHKYTHAQHALTSPAPTRFNSTYLPEFINPLEWQKSRKRKERLDSTSSATQDRKLQRSNSEELLPQQQLKTAAVAAAAQQDASVRTGVTDVALKASNAPIDVIRRVSSEDFKKTTSYAAYLQDLKEAAEKGSNSSIKEQQDIKEQQTSTLATDENDASLANRQESQAPQPLYDSLPAPFYRETWQSGPTKDMTRRTRYETSPMRSQRHSPIRIGSGNGASNGNGSKHSDSNDSECEHERRRSSERFCKSRAPPGRKAAGVTKKSNSSSSAGYLSSKRNDENAYKYDLSALKHERRGFISKKIVSTPAAEKSSANANGTAMSDLNDNNLIDFHQQKQKQQAQQQQAQHNSNASSTLANVATNSNDDAAAAATTLPATPPIKKTNHNNIYNYPSTSAQEALPWDRSVPEDQTPVLSRRYAAVRLHPADNLDTAAKLSKIMPYPQQLHKQTAAQILADDLDDCMDDSFNAYRAFTSLENVRTRDVMQQVIPAMMSFQSPEERLKQVNKRLTAMKKKLTQLEESFEARMGYRPSQAERLNDKYMKNILAELSKLRKERHELKSDPMTALGLKVSGGMNDAKKLDNMKVSLLEIEQNLTDKREDANRSEVLEELTPDQLVQEKTAVQHGLLYLESLYGRPGTKDERDAARPLYDRYRQLKRMVSRSVLLSGSTAAGAPELPTILEHEAMVFEFTPQQYSSNNSTDTTNSPSDSVAPNAQSSDDSTTTNTAAQETSTASTVTADTNENISAFSIEQLWEHLEKTREEKKMLKRTIREYETVFEEQNGRKMLKSDRKLIEETYAQYKEKKAKTRLLQALIKKQISR